MPLLRSVAHVIFASGGDVPAWMLSLPKVHKQKFKARDPDSNGASSASEVAKKKQYSKSHSESSEDFRKSENLRKQGKGMPKKNLRSIQKNQKPSKKNTKSSKKE